MTRMIVESQIGADGVLRLAVPVGQADANHAVKVTIEPLPPFDGDQAKYIAWLDGFAGNWQGDFEQMPQGEFEVREPLIR